MVGVEELSSETLPVWLAPHTRTPIDGVITMPGSKSITNRAFILAALADGPSAIVGALRSRDTNLMLAALKSIGVGVRDQGSEIHIEPRPLRGGTINCGLAGTVMRFVPPVAAIATGTVFFDGDPQARTRPMSTMLDALRDLGIQVQGDALPFIIDGVGTPTGGTVDIDASGSSQFVSGLLLAGARFSNGITVRHTGGKLPSMPHIEMTIAMLAEAGVTVDTSRADEWTVPAGPISGRTWRIEPDLSNATPFLAAAAVTGGTVRIRHWPQRTTQPGDAIRGILERMGCTVDITAVGPSYDLVVTGPAGGVYGEHGLKGISIDLSDVGELTPTVAALAALANTESRLTGITHLRGHETDRLAALTREINNIGGQCTELADGLCISPVPREQLHGGLWHSYADHRMATAGAIIGLAVPGIEVEDIATTTKTLPDFANMWTKLVAHG